MHDSGPDTRNTTPEPSAHDTPPLKEKKGETEVAVEGIGLLLDEVYERTLDS